MVTQVLDSTDTAGILAQAGVILDAPEAEETPPEAIEQEQNTEVRAVEEEEEDENGLTEQQRKDLTEKMQKAVGKKHRMLKEAEEFAAAQYSERKLAEQRAAQLERELEELRKNATPAEKQADPLQKPDRANFASETDYLDAMIEWGVETRLQKEREEAKKREAEERYQQALATAKARINKAMELVPDYADVVGSVDTVVPAVVASYMQKSELFAELGYHLAKNPELLASIAKLEPDEQLVTIGKIESKLSPFGSGSARTKDDKTSSTSNGKPVKDLSSHQTGEGQSKPRAPVITPLNSTGASADKDFSEMNIREAIADYAKKRQVNLNLRKRH